MDSSQSVEATVVWPQLYFKTKAEAVFQRALFSTWLSYITQDN